ncbi:MAG TPA: hypothetical protein VOA41_18280 [Candidatus Dormibacteraeota bacterium]|nr:hypothetical protein [Candidatus Dormibacteraeota bacterium]
MIASILDGRMNIGQFEPSQDSCIHCVLNSLGHSAYESGGNVQACAPGENLTLATPEGVDRNPNVGVHTDATSLADNLLITDTGISHSFTIEKAIEFVIHHSNTCPEIDPQTEVMIPQLTLSTLSRFLDIITLSDTMRRDSDPLLEG